jgi:hypothetical protein
MLLPTIVVTSLSACLYMDMPAKPSLEQLCADSAIVVSAEAVREGGEVEPFADTSYALVVFQPTEVLKGGSLLMSLNPKVGGRQAADPGLFAVMLVTRWRFSDLLPATYVPGKRYILFLGPPCAPWVYGRARIDSRWPEQAYSEDLARRIRSIVADQASVTLRRPKRDAGYLSIPTEAQEHPVPLTENDVKNGYSRRVFYTIGDQRVGERGWWSSGKMAYEEPMRDGRREGLFRGWYPDGRLWQECYYRNGYGHGLARVWDEHGALSTSFWLDGRNVTKEAYLQEMQLDPSLPRIQDATSRPSSRPAVKGTATGTQPSHPTTQPTGGEQ